MAGQGTSVPALEAALASLLPEVLAFRHDIHMHPEPGFEEVRTHSEIRKVLQSLGITQVKVLATTGIVADIVGEGPPLREGAHQPKCIALRADMDALRMTESNVALPYRSKNDKAAHMCGHDGHMAALLGAANLIFRARDRLPQGSRVRLLFQPAEEGPGGALPMIKEGCLHGVDEVYGHHNWPTQPVGTISVVPGPTMAHVIEFEIVITGRGGHASQPHAALDPVVTSAHVITALQTIVSRSCHSWDNAVVTVAAVSAGTTFNVIPEKAHLKGTIRDLSKPVAALIVERLKTIVHSTCAAFGCTADLRFCWGELFKILIQDLYPVLVNHPAETEHVRRVAAQVVGPSQVTTGDLPIMGAEDFAYFLEHVPGCFFFLGGKEEGRTNAMCHSSHYDYNDHILPIAIAMWVRLVEDRLGAKLYT